MFLFFKQKTAYEIRISDWSSDVCSSDLLRGLCPLVGLGLLSGRQLGDTRCSFGLFAHKTCCLALGKNGFVYRRLGPQLIQRFLPGMFGKRYAFLKAGVFVRCHIQRNRSEEHTSELQSLMRISYAVFCLKKKK